MLLAGKKVVVVGGSSGIGLLTAEMARREGADVIIASRNVERLDRAADALNAIAIPADVTKSLRVLVTATNSSGSATAPSKKSSAATAGSR